MWRKLGTESPAAPADVVQNELEGLVKATCSWCVDEKKGSLLLFGDTTEKSWKKIALGLCVNEYHVFIARECQKKHATSL